MSISTSELMALEKQIKEAARSSGMSEEQVRGAIEKIALTAGGEMAKLGEQMEGLAKNMANAMSPALRASAEQLAALEATLGNQTAVDRLARIQRIKEAAAAARPNPDQRRAQLEQEFHEFTRRNPGNPRRLNEQAFATLLRQRGESIAGWMSSTLLSQLPEKANDSNRLDALTAWQVMCLAEYSRRNCSTPTSSTYEAALIGSIVPELIRRIETTKRLESEPPAELVTFRAAWELYRSGAATLEEIGPLMDKAMNDSDPGEP